jgi:hypothetical protein
MASNKPPPGISSNFRCKDTKAQGREVKQAKIVSIGKQGMQEFGMVYRLVPLFPFAPWRLRAYAIRRSRGTKKIDSGLEELLQKQ